MADESNTDGILDEPLQPGPFRICPKCGKWFSLKLISQRDNELQGSIATYQCKKCDATIDFAEHHRPDAI